MIRREDDEGAVAVIVAVLLSTVLFVVAAMAVDLGEAFSRRQIVQDAADLAALAGAGRLPDATAARTAAVASLCDQAHGQPQDLGWPATMCADPSWADDGNEKNGEVTVFGPDDNGNGFRDDGRPFKLPNDDIRAGSTDDERLAGSSSLPGSAIRVLPPPSHVTFHFATAVGIHGVDVDRAATAAMGTPSGLGTPPFFLIPSDAGKVCIQLGINWEHPPTGCTGTARRGYVDEPRNETPEGSSTVIELNVALGLDHGVAPWTSLPAPPNPTPTPALACAGQSGTSLSGAGLLAVNCLHVVATGFGVRGQIEAGLVGTDGRLRRTDTCPGDNNTGGTGGDYSGFDGNSLFQEAFLSAGSTATTSDLHNYLSTPSASVPPLLQGALSSAVLRCPRLLLLPVLAVPTGATGVPQLPIGGAAYPVVTMKYLWVGSDSAGNGLEFDSDGNLRGVRGWLLDPALFSTQVSKSLGLDPYAGLGLPRQVRLVHDREDAQPAITPPLGS